MIAALLLATVVPRFVTLHFDVNAYGVPGSATITVDRKTGAFVRRFDAGPASEQEGWDGRAAWRADATGLSRVEGNSGERDEIIAWSSALRAAIDGSSRRARIAGATDRIDVTFERFRRAGTLVLPGRIVSQSAQNGAWTADLRSAETPALLAAGTFSPPIANPRDFHLDRLTRIPVSMKIGSPVLDVRVNGRRLRFAFDTGGQNVITPEAAHLASLKVVGRGMVSGGGGGLAPIRYAFAGSVRVGAARMDHQPFIVVPASSLPGIDGIVGYELLARCAARLDIVRGTLELAPDARAFGPPVAPATFAYFDRQPQIDGSLDGMNGAFSIDTGSSLTAQVEAPFVRSRNLVARLHATVAAYAGDVGGRYRIYLVRTRLLRLGGVEFPRPLVDLETREQISSDVTIIANVGMGVLRRWILVLDYRHQVVELRPGGDPSGTVIRDRSGIVLGSKAAALVVLQVLTGTPASRAGVTEGAQIIGVDGRAVSAGDLSRVQTLLRGRPGTKLVLKLQDGSAHEVTLRKYL